MLLCTGNCFSHLCVAICVVAVAEGYSSKNVYVVIICVLETRLHPPVPVGVSAEVHTGVFIPHFVLEVHLSFCIACLNF